MDIALFQLLALRLRAGIRTRLQQLATFRGLVYFGISCLVPLIVWLGFVQSNAPTLQLAEQGSTRIETYLVLGLIAATLLPMLTATSQAFHFSEEEVQFLRAGPFSHQSLLLYKVFSALSGAALTALVLAFATAVVYARLPAAVFFGTLLTMLFVRLAGATARSTWQLLRRMRLQTAFGQRSHMLTWGMLAMLTWLGLMLIGRGPHEAMIVFSEVSGAEYMLLPFQTFVRVTLAERMFPDLLFWSATAAAINLLLLLVMLRIERVLDGFADDAIQQDQTLVSNESGTSRICSVAARRMHSYRLAGAGPMAWRQLVHARRTTGTALLGMAVLAVAGGPILVLGMSAFSSYARIGIAITFAIFVLPKLMTFDFRGDHGTIRWLKGLPIRPSAIVVGQLTTPAVLTSCIELLFLGSVMLLVGDTTASKLLGLVPFVLPFNVLLYSLENLLFLLMPFRVLPAGRVDFEFFGRSVVETLAKMLVLSLVITLSIRTGRVVSEQVDDSFFAFYAVTWTAMVSVAVVAVMLVAGVFKRCDMPSDA